MDIIVVEILGSLETCQVASFVSMSGTKQDDATYLQKAFLNHYSKTYLLNMKITASISNPMH